VKRHPYFDQLRERFRQHTLDHITPEAGSAFQRLLAVARNDLEDQRYQNIIQSLQQLSEDVSHPPISVDHHEAVFLRTVIAAVQAGCDARARASIAFDAKREEHINIRARAWADEFGMAEAHRGPLFGTRNLMTYLIFYVQFLYEETDDGVGPSNASVHDRRNALRYVRDQFPNLNSDEATIETLRRARRDEFVQQNWPRDLAPLGTFKIPGRKG
jgi:hypothetical protein